MFTVGLFSTHVPYLAFVAFYAVFFLLGIEKATAGEPEDGERLVADVISFTVDSYPAAEYEFCDCSCYSPPNQFKQLLLFERKINFLFPECTLAISTRYCYSWFSRPPPVA